MFLAEPGPELIARVLFPTPDGGLVRPEGLLLIELAEEVLLEGIPVG